jgi:hypothetical protein
MGKGSGEHIAKKLTTRLAEMESVINQIPTEDQIREGLFWRRITERFVMIPEARELIKRQWRLKHIARTEEEQDQIRQEILIMLDEFMSKEAPAIIGEMQIGDDLERLNAEVARLIY